MRKDNRKDQKPKSLGMIKRETNHKRTTFPDMNKNKIQKNQIYKRLALFLLLIPMALAGCADKAPVVEPKKEKPPIETKISREKPEAREKVKLDSSFFGAWHVEDSSAFFVIKQSGQDVILQGHDYDDREPFKVTSISWDSNKLKASFTMPSTKHQIQISLTKLDENTLLCTFSGDAFGETHWIRADER